MAASADDNGGSTLTLRLLSMGVIAVVSLLGCALPAALHYAHHGRTGAKDDKLLARVPIFSLLKARVCARVCACLCLLLPVLPPSHVATRVCVRARVRACLCLLLPVLPPETIDLDIDISAHSPLSLPTVTKAFAAGIILGVGCVRPRSLFSFYSLLLRIYN